MSSISGVSIRIFCGLISDTCQVRWTRAVDRSVFEYIPVCMTLQWSCRKASDIRRSLETFLATATGTLARGNRLLKWDISGPIGLNTKHACRPWGPVWLNSSRSPKTLSEPTTLAAPCDLVRICLNMSSSNVSFSPSHASAVSILRATCWFVLAVSEI